jgi:Ni/Fe-hydrogenase 1 B-type cytochrome subunit
MATNQVKPETETSLLLQPHSAMIRIWHWLTFILITSIMITVLLNSTLMNPRKNVGMVQEQLKSKGLIATEDQAFAVSHEYEDKIWGVHKWIGYGIAFLLLSRIVIELFQPGQEKFKVRFKNALGLYRGSSGDKKEYRHYLGIKSSYLLFYTLVICMAITGLCLAFGRELGIPRELHRTIKEIHSIGQYFMYGFVIIHLCGVVLAENKAARGLVSGMINGNKAGK